MDGLITWAQARTELTEAQIRHRLRTGVWRRPFRGVLAPADLLLDRVTLIRAAALSCGGDLVVAGTSAAALHGFGVLADPVIHLAGVPTTSRAAQPGVRIHAATLASADVTVLDGVRCTTAARTTLDLARQTPRLDAIALVDAALRCGACTPADLARQLGAHRRLRGVVQAREILALADPGAESPMESRLRLRIVDGGLPRPRTQIPILGGRFRLDLGWEEHRVGAEYDGIGHLDRPAQRSDLARRNRLAALGWTVYSFTDTDVYRDHRTLVATLRRALSCSARTS